MNLREKIQALCNSTTSAEVRAICESFLQSKDSANAAESSLFESLNGVRTADSQVNTLLNEQEDLQKSITGIETKISKNAAQKLMESWGGVGSSKVSNIGNHVNKVMIREKEKEVQNEKAIMEGLNAIAANDSSASKVLEGLKMGSYGVYESVSALKSSNMAKHPQFKYILEKFEGYINSNIAESKIVTDYMSSLSAFTWDKEVNESYNTIKSNVDGKAVELEVQNAIQDIKSTDTKGFFSSVVEKLNNWLNNENRNVPTLIKEMKAYQFNSIVKNLTNRVMLMENAKGTAFNVPVNSSNCTVSSIYSPVIMKGGMQIFKAGDNFYASSKDGVHKMSEAQVNALPAEFLSLCEAFFNPSVKVVNDNVVVYVGKNKVTLGDTIKVNESQVSKENLGSTLMTYSQGTIFGATSPMIKVAVTLSENLDNIMEIDFGKAIFSNLYEGVGVYMFRRADKIYLNKVNPSMNENRFFEANGLQAVKFVKNFLSYNVSESLSDLLSGAALRKTEMEKQLNTVMGNITLLESELNKIEAAISANPEIADLPEISSAKEIVSNELNAERSNWQTINTELKNFENADEETEGEPVEIVDEPAADNNQGDGGSDDNQGGDDNQGDDNGGDDNGGGEPPVPTEDVVNVGLAGAEGAQVQAQTIPGNDNQDVVSGEPAADAAAPAPTAQVVDAGFAGAEGAQSAEPAQQNMADVTTVPATSNNAEITVPDNIAPNAQDAEPAPAPVDAAVVTDVNAGEPAAAEPAAVDAADAQGGENIEPAAADQGEEKSNEALDMNVQVKLKGSDKIGKITASNSTEHTFTVLWDDGETGEYNADSLEEIKPESADNQADNQAEAEKEAGKVAEAEDQADANEPENIDVYVKATITIDFGPYKEGEQIEINAADYTAAGDDDPVKVKEPKEEIGTLPKKYVKVVDEAPKSEMNEVKSKVDGVIKNLEEIGTILKGDGKMDSKSIEEALEKLKAYSGAISKESNS